MSQDSCVLPPDPAPSCSLFNAPTRRLTSHQWGWDDAWAYYFCGGGTNLYLDFTGLEPVVKKAWQDLHLEQIKKDVCEGKMPKTYSVTRPGVLSPYYWIGGFAITVTATKDGKCRETNKDKYIVEVKMNDHFDCDPGFGDTYFVYRTWTFTVCCCPEDEDKDECEDCSPGGGSCGDPHFQTWIGDWYGE